MGRKLFTFKAAGLAVLGLFLMVGIATISFGFTNGKSGKAALVSIYYNIGNGVYTATPPAPIDECTLNDPYPCSITLNTAIDDSTYPTFIYRGEDDNTLPAASDGISEVSPENKKSLY